MEQNALKAVLDVEREIKDILDVEREKAGRWLEQADRDTEHVTQAQMARLAESRAARLEAAKQKATAGAAAIVRQAQEAAERIERLDDQHLQAIVWQRIAGIAPERST